jgi:acyl dehydratase
MAESSAITEELAGLLGVEQEPLSWEVEKGHIKRFAQAIGHFNKLWQDEEYARKEGYDGILAPPTLPMTWGAVEFVEKLKAARCALTRLVNAGVEFEYYRPVVVGDTITTVAKLIDLYEKKGKFGPLLFMVIEVTYKNQRGELVAKRRQTHIKR